MYAGDETTSWNDAGPCPVCGSSECWLGCVEDLDVEDDCEDFDDPDFD